VQELGLEMACRDDQGAHTFIGKVIALPFLEKADIRPQFGRLQQNATTAPLREFVNYVSSTWIESNT